MIGSAQMDLYPLPRASAASIGGIALIVGGIAFALGFFGSFVLYPGSNLAPLLGIFITGPVGFVAGALIGAVRSSRSARQGAAWRELAWLAAMWLFSLLYTFIFAWGWGWIGLLLQAAVIATAAYLSFGTGVRPLPRPIAPFRAPMLGAGVLALLASVFPPIVTRGDGQQRFAWFRDPRFDARYEMPEFSVDSSALALEWLILIVTALAIGFVLSAVNGRRPS
jgi:hypothetical protein